jgi:hypothetical protein
VANLSLFCLLLIFLLDCPATASFIYYPFSIIQNQMETQYSVRMQQLFPRKIHIVSVDEIRYWQQRFISLESVLQIT